MPPPSALPISGRATRELVLHTLYEAAELEHNLMCTYLYAAFSLRSGIQEGLSAREAEATARWRREILAVATDEMSHLVAVWNITSALGGVPRFGRTNFPLDPGYGSLRSAKPHYNTSSTWSAPTDRASPMGMASHPNGTTYGQRPARA
jgi:hypothetical protein